MVALSSLGLAGFAGCGSPRLSASLGPNGAALQMPQNGAQGGVSGAAHGVPRKAQRLPLVDPGAPCRLEGVKLGEGLVVQGPEGQPIVNVSRVPGITKATLQLSPTTVLGVVQAETETFTFHGETKIDKLTVFPKSGALAQAGTSYRGWSHLEPGSAKADGKVSLAAALPYSWFTWKKGPAASSLPVQVACADLGLSPGSPPAHIAKAQGSTQLRSDAQVDFRDLAAGPVTARVVFPQKDAVNGGTVTEVEVFVLGKSANGSLAQVDMRIGQDLSAVGFVPTTALRPIQPITGQPHVAVVDTKPAAATSAAYIYRRCNMTVPLWAVVPGPNPANPTGPQPRIVELGTIKSGRTFRGALAANGDFRVDVGDSDTWSDKAPAVDSLDPFVSKESLVTVGCGEVPASAYTGP